MRTSPVLILVHAPTLLLAQHTRKTAGSVSTDFVISQQYLLWWEDVVDLCIRYVVIV